MDDVVYVSCIFLYSLSIPMERLYSTAFPSQVKERQHLYLCVLFALLRLVFASIVHVDN